MGGHGNITKIKTRVKLKLSEQQTCLVHVAACTRHLSADLCIHKGGCRVLGASKL